MSSGASVVEPANYRQQRRRMLSPALHFVITMVAKRCYFDAIFFTIPSRLSSIATMFFGSGP
jgi:hypothetical protein